MSIVSQIRQARRFDLGIFAIGLLATPFCLLSDFGEGFTGKFWSFFPPIGLVLVVLYFAYVPAAMLLLIRSLILLNKQKSLGICGIVGVAIIVFTGWLGHTEGRLHMTLRGFLSHLKTQVSAEALQKASMQIIDGQAKPPAFESSVNEFGETNIVPMFAKTLFWSQPPRFIEVYSASNEASQHYSMQWGGHFIGFIGVTAGPPGYVFSDTNRCDWLKWKPGIYVWARSEFGPIREESE